MNKKIENLPQMLGSKLPFLNKKSFMMQSESDKCVYEVMLTGLLHDAYDLFISTLLIAKATYGKTPEGTL